MDAMLVPRQHAYGLALVSLKLIFARHTAESAAVCTSSCILELGADKHKGMARKSK